MQFGLHAKTLLSTKHEPVATLALCSRRRSVDSPYKAAKHHKHVFDVQVSVDLPGLVLGGGHGSAHSCNVGVVPGVVVHYDSPVGHGCCLVSIVPPTSHLSKYKVPCMLSLNTSFSTIVSVYSKHVQLNTSVKGVIQTYMHSSLAVLISFWLASHIYVNAVLHKLA